MSKEPYPSETAERFIVRFPDGMRDRIKEAAAANNRSMNAEIIHRLEISLGADALLDDTLSSRAHTDDSAERVTLLLSEALAIVQRHKGERG